MRPVKKNKKQKLLDRAAKAHSKGRKKGKKIVGFRTVANPRFLDPVQIPVFKREQKLRDKAKNVTEKEKTGKVKKRGSGYKFGIPGLKGLFKRDASTKARSRGMKCNKRRCKSFAFN
tara:strand:- start:1439 stop:1789 length:351 start_codon:yes stop_codon:yes gene_type:complete